MRIALYHNLPSGGAKRAVYEMVRRLSGAHQIDVFTLSSANQEFADLRPHVDHHQVTPFHPGPLLKTPFGRLNQAVRLADLYRLQRLTRVIAHGMTQGDYDVLFVHPCRFEKSPSIIRFVDLPVVYYCQEPPRKLHETLPYRPYDGLELNRRQLLNKIDPLPSLYYAYLDRTDRRNALAADVVLVNSHFTLESVQRIYNITARVSYLGTDVHRFRPMGMQPKGFVLSVGSLTRMKGFDFLVQAMGEMPADGRPPLVITSNFQNPQERMYLEQLADALEVDLRVMVNVTDEQLVELYNQAAVVAYTPHREPFGLVPLEAMACGTPVVAVREGGVMETVIHEKTGLLVERSPALFAQALQRLLADPALAQMYGRNGRTVVEQAWTWDKAAATVENHLLTAVKQSPSVNHLNLVH